MPSYQAIIVDLNTESTHGFQSAIAAYAPFLQSYEVLQCIVTLSMLGASAPFSRCNTVDQDDKQFVRYYPPHPLNAGSAAG